MIQNIHEQVKKLSSLRAQSNVTVTWKELNYCDLQVKKVYFLVESIILTPKFRQIMFLNIVYFKYKNREDIVVLDNQNQLAMSV